jgi:hypothetical protein
MLVPSAWFYRRRIVYKLGTSEPEFAILAELMPHGGTAEISESFDYDAVLVQRGRSIAALGKNMSWGTDMETHNVLFLPR